MSTPASSESPSLSGMCVDPSSSTNTPRRVSIFIVRVMMLCNSACSASSVGAGASTNSGAPSDLSRCRGGLVLAFKALGGEPFYCDASHAVRFRCAHSSVPFFQRLHATSCGSAKLELGSALRHANPRAQPLSSVGWLCALADLLAVSIAVHRSSGRRDSGADDGHGCSPRRATRPQRHESADGLLGSSVLMTV